MFEALNSNKIVVWAEINCKRRKSSIVARLSNDCRIRLKKIYTEKKMKGNLYKILLVVCITAGTVFVVLGMLFAFGVVPWQNAVGPVFALFASLLAVSFVVTAAYLLFETFWKKEKADAMLLFGDKGGAVRLDKKVVRSVVDGCARQVDGIIIKKIRLAENQKHGYDLQLTAKVKTSDVCASVTAMRQLVEQSFERELCVKFDSLDIFVDSLNGRFTPKAIVSNDQDEAEEKQKSLSEKSSETEESRPEATAESQSADGVLQNENRQAEQDATPNGIEKEE